MAKDMQTQLNEAAAEEARERDESVDRAMSKLGLDADTDPGAYDALAELYDEGYGSGQQWEYSHPS